MKYLNKFDTRSDYEASASTLEIPNVAYITATTEVIYNATPTPEPPEYVEFDDPLVESKCATLYGDGTGCTEIDLAAVTTISASDWAGTNITSFDELEYFIGITNIPSGLFHDCSGLTSVVIPDSVTYIDAGAFLNCSSLTSVTLGNSVSRLWLNAFYGCSALPDIIFPASVTRIDGTAFFNNSSLSSITFEATTLPATIASDAFNGVPTTGDITVPDGYESNFYSFAQSLGSGWTVNEQTPPAPPASNYVLFESSATTAEQGTYQITLSGVTISGNSDENKVWLYQTAAYRFLRDCNFDIVSTGGNITKIEFTQKDSSYPVTNISAATGTYTVDSGVGTWEASSPLSTVSFSCPSGQARCSSIKVYLE